MQEKSETKKKTKIKTDMKVESEKEEDMMAQPKINFPNFNSVHFLIGILLR